MLRPVHSMSERSRNGEIAPSHAPLLVPGSLLTRWPAAATCEAAGQVQRVLVTCASPLHSRVPFPLSLNHLRRQSAVFLSQRRPSRPRRVGPLTVRPATRFHSFPESLVRMARSPAEAVSISRRGGCWARQLSCTGGQRGVGSQARPGLTSAC